MNRPAKINRTAVAPVDAVHVTGPGRSPVPGPVAAYSRIARVPGEAYDADQIGWSCEECGRDEYACDCEPEAWFDTPSPMTLGEVERQIARVFGTRGVVTEDEGGSRVGL